MEGWASYAVTAPSVSTAQERESSQPITPSVARKVRQALRALPATQRAIVDAHASGLPKRAIAYQLGISRDCERVVREASMSTLRARLIEAIGPSVLEQHPTVAAKGIKMASSSSTRSTSKVALNGVTKGQRGRAPADSNDVEAGRRELAALLASIPHQQTRVVEISPAIAVALLERNRTNRSVARSRVAMLAHDMCAGAWEIGNNALGIGEDGELYDGQHRLHAVVRANRTVKMPVMRGLSRQARATIDQGRPRSVGDNLRILDGEIHGSRIVGWLNAIEVIETRRSTPLSHAMVRARMVRFKDAIQWFTEHAPKGRPFYRAAVVGALVFAYRARRKEVQEFARGYASGAGLPEGSPVLTLRDYVADPVRIRADTKRDISLKTLRCLAAYVQDETLEKLFPAEDTIDLFRTSEPRS